MPLLFPYAYDTPDEAELDAMEFAGEPDETACPYCAYEWVGDGPCPNCGWDGVQDFGCGCG